jgi:hypothetical protein
MSSVFLRQYTVIRVDKKLRQPHRMKQYSSIREMEHFFDMQIDLIRRFATMKTKYFEAQGYSLSGIFLPFSVLTRRSFPTNESKSQWRHQDFNLRPPCSITTHYSTTAPHLLCLVLSAMCLGSSVYSVHHRQYCVFIRMYCAFFCQQCVTFRQYCVFLRQHSVHLCKYCVFFL